MNLIILDISTSNFSDVDILLLKNNNNNSIILALSPSSFYLLEHNNIEYISFHDIVTTKEFQQDILNLYDSIINLNIKNNYFKGFFRDISQYVNYYYYIEILMSYIKIKDFANIHYITDKECSNLDIITNRVSLLYKYISFSKVTIIDRKNSANRLKKNLLFKYSITTLLKKIKNKLFNNMLRYDWLRMSLIIKKKNIKVNQSNIVFNIQDKYFSNIKCTDLKFTIVKNISVVISYMTFLTKDLYIQALEYKELNNQLYFFQHGSYLYKNIFIKYSEIELADINFVFNDYTKNLFEDLGAKKVHSVGSIIFNEPIKEKNNKYDFLYITQGHDYLGNLQYIDFPNSLHSFDGYELYQRHKDIIKLFGTKFKDKKIMIRVHPCVVTTGVYVPFWELAEPYSNITIDVSIPIHTLIEKSKYIISDYFTTEFINRELHYKKDIILFQGAPTPLPEETLEDMQKMFILVDTVDDLEDKVANIEGITKNRKRYDDIIEYYSSKKCDTKKVVTEILEKELKQ
jgi:hypothetical protein